MDELMAASDLFVGKPGGLTTSEALAKGMPMVVINPIPGQEERNSDHLLEEGIAIRCNNLPALAYKIDRLIDEPGKLHLMRGNAPGPRQAPGGVHDRGAARCAPQRAAARVWPGFIRQAQPTTGGQAALLGRSNPGLRRWTGDHLFGSGTDAPDAGVSRTPVRNFLTLPDCRY